MSAEFSGDREPCPKCGYDLFNAGFDALEMDALVLRASDVKSRSVRWAWSGRLPIGYLTVTTGEEGLGKSVFAAWAFAQLSWGLLPGEWQGEPANVLVLAGEDGIEDTWKPRLQLAEADLSRVSFLNFQQLGAGWNLRDGLDLLAEVVGYTSAQVVYVDAALDHMPPPKGGESINSPTFTRQALMPLKDLMRERDGVGWFSMHPPKARGTSFRELVQASQAFTAIPRVGLLVAWHPEDVEKPEATRRRVLIRGKGNLGRDPGALEFKIVGRQFKHDDETVQEREVVVDVRPSTVTKADLFGKDRQQKPTKIEQAMDVIRLHLGFGAWTEAASIRERLEEQGLNHNSTVNEATKRLHVEKTNKLSGKAQGPWYWRLPIPGVGRESDAEPDAAGGHEDAEVRLSDSLAARARDVNPDSDSLTNNGSNPNVYRESQRVSGLEPEGTGRGRESESDALRAHARGEFEEGE